MNLLGWSVALCSGVAVTTSSVSGLISLWSSEFHATGWQLYCIYVSVAVSSGNILLHALSDFSAKDNCSLASLLFRSMASEDLAGNARLLCDWLSSALLPRSCITATGTAAFIFDAVSSRDKRMEFGSCVDHGRGQFNVREI